MKNEDFLPHGRLKLIVYECANYDKVCTVYVYLSIIVTPPDEKNIEDLYRKYRYT